MGGGVAWATAILFPERVDRLILIDCVPPDVLHQVKNESFRMLAAIKDIPFLPYLVMAARNKSSIRQILLECVSDIRLITRSREPAVSTFQIKGTPGSLLHL
jgi:pimeloyl-ACP methyl ester carboxylesterase